MKNVWAYNPEVCDGDFCPMDCDHCRKLDEALGEEEKLEDLREGNRSPFRRKP